MPWNEPKKTRAAFLAGLIIASATLTACGDEARLPEEATTGPSPTLPEPTRNIIPTINVAKAIGWGDGETPRAAHGFEVNAFARDLDHPRWLYVLPNGDVLVAESNAPDRPEEGQGVRGAIFGLALKRAGAAVKSADRITLLRDANGDGVAETRSMFLDQLHSPIGMALVGSDLFIANTDAVLRFPYKDGATKIDEKPVKIADLPAGSLNHHWTKTLVASPDGRRLYVGVGSNSNAGENGLHREKDRAAILEIDVASGKSRVFASGLRNPVGMAWEPSTGELWTVVNERDELGSDLVPDYLTSVKDGGFYGWPFSYWGQQ
jgi:glucose/arabinose dehydrogenase